jgi:hypothetical protein
MLRQSLAIWQQHFGADHYEVAGVRLSLAVLYAARGETRRAERTYHQVLDIKRRVLGPEHHEVVALQGQLGQLNSGS